MNLANGSVRNAFAAASIMGGIGAAAQSTNISYEVPHSGAASFYSTAGLVGQEVTLQGAGPGASFNLSTISFEYYSNYALQGGITVRVYENDGPNGAPGTQLYPIPGQTGTPIDIQKAGQTIGGFVTSYLVTVHYSLPLVPPEFTVAVQFAGVGGDQVAGLTTPNSAPTTGSSPGYFWENDNGSWATRVLTASQPYFTMTVTTVPEPGSVALALVGGVGLSLLGWRRSA